MSKIVDKQKLIVGLALTSVVMLALVALLFDFGLTRYYRLPMKHPYSNPAWLLEAVAIFIIVVTIIFFIPKLRLFIIPIIFIALVLFLIEPQPEVQNWLRSLFK